MILLLNGFPVISATVFLSARHFEDDGEHQGGILRNSSFDIKPGGFLAFPTITSLYHYRVFDFYRAFIAKKI